MKRTLALLILAVAVPALVRSEDDSDRFSRIRYREGGVVLQRAEEGASEEAVPNLPFLSGDRLWTDSSGRVELQFDDGSIVRLDSASKLDFTAVGRRNEIALRLWSGSVFLHTKRRAETFELDTPGGLVTPREEGVYRIDVAEDDVRVSVYQGSLLLDSGRRRITIESGEQGFSRAGEYPEGPDRLDRRDSDEFARWDAEREDRLAWAGDGSRYLPDEVEPYAADLESHGSWYFEADIGYVWRPHVSVGWRPYCNGHWIWTYYGWTWVPDEPWGWAPYHYGRWGHTVNLGWYWIPGHVWGPAWVNWAVGSDYVGWCPLGRHDRPVHVQPSVRGHAALRGAVTALNAADSQAWVITRRSDLTSRDVARRRIEATPAQLKEVRVFDSPSQRPMRDLRVVEVREGAAIKTRPTLGESVPELRHDPKTTIPRAWPRPGLEPLTERRDTTPRGDSGSTAARRDVFERARPAEKSNRAEPSGSAAERWRNMGRIRPSAERDAATTRPSSDTWRTTRPSSERQRSREADTPSSDSSSSSTSSRWRNLERTRPPEHRGTDRSPSNDGMRDVLRRFFQPVTDPQRNSGSDRSAPRVQPNPPTARPAPREAAPRSQPDRARPAPTHSSTAKPRDREKN